MKRSEFLRQLGLIAGGVTFGLDGTLGRAFAHNPMMMDLATANGNILVLIQLSGGNDGLNTVIPYEDSVYYTKRPALAIKKTDALPINETLGLHPSLSALRPFYDKNQFTIINNVGYGSPNRSHFRSTDIWMSASESSQYLTEGWMGRYLTNINPAYPATLPEHPMAVQLGSVESMLLLSQMGNTATVFEDPNQFFQLVSGSKADTDPPPATLAGDELKFLKQVASQSIQYSGIIKEKADKGKNTVTYPGTNLARQLGIVGKLISGGIQTPVYLTTLGGFDTHANQLTAHANLLKTLADATAAFLSDMDRQGLGEKVTVMTFSEFGRRLNQNGTAGTDHGTAAPLFVLGKSVKGGLLGGNPNLSDLDSSGDIKFRHDFRQIYSTVLRDYLGMNEIEARTVLNGKEFGKLPIFRTSIEAVPSDAAFELLPNYPNPVRDVTTFRFSLNRPQRIRLSLLDLTGQELAVLRNEPMDTGVYAQQFDASTLPEGLYLYSLQGDGGRRTLRMAVHR
jgi:uncharacterized protein (DUF1501 family)